MRAADDPNVASSQDRFVGVLAAAQDGQEWAVARLYDAFHRPVLRFLTWQEPGVGEDLASETWLAVAERIGTFEGDEQQFKAWIFAIARRRLAAYRGRTARRRTRPVPDDVLCSLPGGIDPADLAIDKLSSEQVIERLTGSLSSDQAEVLVLRIVGGLTVEETARVVSKRPGAVRVIQHRALRRLASELGHASALQV